MNQIHNSYLSVEEQILLSSFKLNNITDCMREVEELLSLTDTDDENHDMLVGLLDKLQNGHINISSEVEYIPDDEREDIS